MVVYRRVTGQATRRGQTPAQALNIVCDRLAGGLSNAGIEVRRQDAPQIHDWLLRWFNPQPRLLGPTAEDRARSEEHTSELQSLMRISYAVFCLKKKNTRTKYKQ